MADGYTITDQANELPYSVTLHNACYFTTNWSMIALWVKENCHGEWKWSTSNSGSDLPRIITFYFSDIEDAVLFKLRF